AGGVGLEGEVRQVGPRDALGRVGGPPIGVGLLDALEGEMSWREGEVGRWRVREKRITDCDPSAWLVRLAPPVGIFPVVRLGLYPAMELDVTPDGYSTALLVVLPEGRPVLDVEGLGPVDLGGLS
ncbi:MAG: hypothetical protein QI223_05295, partial [Candidatus Korarchaeota archaeon]|nr:hypothetical protein [Candidatus Korarchaeota archaeon]